MPTGRRRTPSKTEEARAKNKVGAAKATATPASKRSKGTAAKTGRATTTTTGGSTRTVAQRKKDNAGVKNGDVKLGAGGKFYNRYNASTGRWERIGSKTGSAGENYGNRVAKSRQAISGTVAAAKSAKASTVPGRDTGNHKPTMYANGTARVWDAKQKKFVTVGKSNPLHPKYGK